MNNISESHVEVRSSPTSGNGLFATRDIGAGELVLMVNRPFVGVLSPARVQDTCANCFMWSVGSIEDGFFAHPVSVNACAGCKMARYCSKKCQSQAWKREHKLLCKSLKALGPSPSDIRAAKELSVLLNSNAVNDATKDAISRMESDPIGRVRSRMAKHRLGNDTPQASRPEEEDCRAQGIPTYSYMNGVEIDPECVGKILRNSLTLVTPTFDPVGLAFDPTLCMANHSCDPNTAIVMDGPWISMRSLVPIPSGAEVFISYIDNTNPFSVRQAELSDRYSFVCKCQKCLLGSNQRENQWLHPASHLPKKWKDKGQSLYDDRPYCKEPRYHVGDTVDEKRLASLQALAFEDLEEARKVRTPQEAVKRIEDVMRLCKQSTLWPVTRQPYAAARSEIFAALLLAQNPGIAMYHLIKTYFAVDPVLYPQDFHPVRVVHAWSLAKVMLWLYERPEHSATQQIHATGFDFVVPIWKLLKQVKRLVRKSHGPGRLQVLADRTAGEVESEIGEANLRIIEADPQSMWEVFERWKDALEF